MRGAWSFDKREHVSPPTARATEEATSPEVYDRDPLTCPPEDSLAQNDAYRALTLAEDLIVTGPTGTNVADLCFVMVGEGRAIQSPKQGTGIPLSNRLALQVLS